MTMKRKKRRNSITLILCCICTFLLLCSCAHKSGHRNKVETTQAQSNNNRSAANYDGAKPVVKSVKRNSDKLDGSEIFKRYRKAVFMVLTQDEYAVYQGSGFFINDQGLAISNYHVFQGTGIGDEVVKIEGDDNDYKVSQVIKKDENNDFILFKVNVQNTTYLPIAKTKPQVGDRVFAIGSPRGLINTFSSGEVSQWRDQNLMQISALIDHGSSGGALINEYGEVIGITSGTFAEGSQANLNYAWSIDAIKPYLEIK